MTPQGRYLFPLLLPLAVLIALTPLSHPESAFDVPARRGVAPPPQCVATTTEHFNNAPVTIPAGPAVVASTIDVTSPDPYLFWVEVITGITHTFPADLDITVRSPQGTVVTLTTDNGENFQSAFAAVTWHDGASPGGQVPYSTTVGIASDHDYAAGAPVELVPEEALAAFTGEDPSGTWTLTVSDDAGGDAGVLLRWGLRLTTLERVPSVLPSFDRSASPQLAIPTTVGVISHTIAVSGADPYLFDLVVRTEIDHGFSSDLDMTLSAPGGAISTLSTDNGENLANVFADTLWDDDADPGGQVPYLDNPGLVTDRDYVAGQVASPLVPEEALALFRGLNPNGTWTITISDDEAGDGGTLQGWSITGRSATCAVTPTPTTTPTATPGSGLLHLPLVIR